MLAESKFRSKFKSKFTSRFDRGLLMAGTVMASSSRLPHWVTLGASADLDFIGERYSVEGLTPAFTNIPGATVSGGVNGTVVRDGVIVAATEQNLLTYSEDLTNAAWTAGTNAVVEADAAVAPDGNLTADRLTSVSNPAGDRRDQTVTVPASTAKRLSLWVKAGTQNSGLARLIAEGSGAYTLNITPTSEWVRYVLEIPDTDTATSLICRVYPSSLGATNGDNILVWGAQLRLARYSDTYVPTTSAAITRAAPRIGDDGLLVEGAATNLLTWSEDFTNAAWIKQRASVSTNSIVSPNGTVTADRIAEDSNTNTRGVVQLIALSDNTNYTWSIFAKEGERRWCYLRTIIKDGSVAVSFFDLQSGSLGTVAGAHTAKIEAFSDGWYRLSVTVNSLTGGSSPQVGLLMSTGNNVQTYTGDGSSGLFIWGAQFEEGSFATSYIPTTGSTVTRTADSVTLTDLDALGLTPAVLGELDVPLDDDFTSYADQAAAVAAGFVPSGATPPTFDAVDNQWDFPGVDFVFLNFASAASLVDGAAYVITATWSGSTAGSLRVQYGATNAGQVAHSEGEISAQITWAAGSFIRLQSVGAFDGSIDSITIRRAEPLGGYTVVAEWVPSALNGSERIFSISDGTQDNEVRLQHASSGDDIVLSVRQSATGEVFEVVGDIASNVSQKAAIRVSSDDCAVSLNGASASVDTSATLPSGLDTLALGMTPAGLVAIDGTIRRFTIIPRAVSDAELQALSS